MSTPPPVPPAPQVIYQTIVRPPSNGLAITSVILGPIAVFFAAFVPIPLLGLLLLFVAVPCAVAAIILGHLGLRVAGRIDVGRTPAVIGLICGYLAALVIVVVTAFWVIAAIAAVAHSAS